MQRLAGLRCCRRVQRGDCKPRGGHISGSTAQLQLTCEYIHKVQVLRGVEVSLTLAKHLKRASGSSDRHRPEPRTNADPKRQPVQKDPGNGSRKTGAALCLGATRSHHPHSYSLALLCAVAQPPPHVKTPDPSISLTYATTLFNLLYSHRSALLFQDLTRNCSVAQA